MAERLTNTLEETPKKGFGLKFCSDINCNSDEDCCNCYAFNQAINKLRQFEDIMEKYGIDIQNLDYILEDYAKNQGRDFAICEERDTLRQERATWKRACELACEREDDCYVYDNIHRAYEFYQQAKTEGNDEK